MRAALLLLASLSLGACASPSPPQSRPGPAEDVPVSVSRAIEVVGRVEPVAEALCQAQTPDQNCDFLMLVNRDPRTGVNAFQTVGRDGRPLIILTVGLIAEVENADELAFVIGHEAAHHIARHITAQRSAAEEGARIFGATAQSRGAVPEEIMRAAQLGAAVGARRFSQNAELEADALGTVIAFNAGFDPLIGSNFFDRLPDPGDQFLGTHPPNAARRAIVQQTVAQLRLGG